MTSASQLVYQLIILTGSGMFTITNQGVTSLTIFGSPIILLRLKYLDGWFSNVHNCLAIKNQLHLIALTTDCCAVCHNPETVKYVFQNHKVVKAFWAWFAVEYNVPQCCTTRTQQRLDWHVTRRLRKDSEQTRDGGVVYDTLHLNTIGIYSVNPQNPSETCRLNFAQSCDLATWSFFLASLSKFERVYGEPKRDSVSLTSVLS